MAKAKDKDKDKDKKDTDQVISFGRKHYWTDTQGHAHRIVFDDKRFESPRANWTALLTVTAMALIIGSALILSLRPDNEVVLPTRTQNLTPAFVFERTLSSDELAHASAIAAGWNDEFFVANASGVSLFDASGKKLESWSFDEPTPATALAFVSNENNSSNGLLLAGFGDVVKSLQFSLDQFVPAAASNDETLPGDADAETETNNAVVRTCVRGALGAPKTLLVRSGADIRGLECSGERLFVADYAAGCVWRYSLKKLYARDPDLGEPTPDCDLGEPDELRGYPGLKPAFRRNFSVSYLNEKNILYVASSGLFRVDAFDPETGAWSPESSWSKVPGALNAFRGVSNPIAIEAKGDLFLTAESGVFRNESTQERTSPLRLYDSMGSMLVEFGPGAAQRSDDYTVVDVAASSEMRFIYVLNSDGSVDVWNRQYSR